MSLEIKLKNLNQCSSKHKLSHSNMTNIISLKTSSTTNKSSFDPNFNMYSLYNFRDDLHKAEVKKINKNFKKFLQNEKEKRIFSLNNIHKETLKESFQEKFYITESNSITINKNLFKDERLSANYDPLYENSIKEKKEKILIQNFPNNFSYNKINLFNKSLNESPQDFIKHVKNIRLSKFLIMTKQETVTRLKEKRDNEVEELHDTIATNRNNLKFFSETIEKLNKFWIYVQIQKEKEKDRLDNFQSQKTKLESDLKKIESKTIKLKLYVEKLKECRNFLICVKEKVRWLPDSFYTQPENKIKSNRKTIKIIKEKSLRSSVERSKMKNVSLTKSFGLDNSSLQEKYYASIKSINLSKEHLPVSVSFKPGSTQNEARYEKYNSLNIKDNLFKSTNEFFQELKSLENKNIILIHQHNDLMEKYDKIKQKNFKVEGSRETFSCDTDEVNEIVLRENILKKLKNQNQNLKEKVKDLSQPDDEKNIFKSKERYFKQDSTNFQYVLKISSIFDFLNLNLSLSKLKCKFYKSYIAPPEEITLLKLKEIENAINFLCDKYAYYKRSITYKTHLEILENELEKERKKTKTKELLILENKRIKKLKYEIISKNKIFVVSRKTGMRFEPFKNLKKISNEVVSKGENEFDQLVSF